MSTICSFHKFRKNAKPCKAQATKQVFSIKEIYHFCEEHCEELRCKPYNIWKDVIECSSAWMHKITQPSWEGGRTLYLCDEHMVRLAKDVKKEQKEGS